MKNIIGLILSSFSLLALCFVSLGTLESSSNSEMNVWSSPAAEQSFDSDGNIDGLATDEAIYATTLASADVENYQQYTSGACTRSTGCSTGCSVGCSNGCSVGCSTGCYY